MIKIVKLLIWIVGSVVLLTFLLNYFGYEINKKYFTERKADCWEKLNACKKEFVRQGIDNAKCDFNCVDPALIIKKK